MEGKLILITNIATPYRNFFFKILYNVLSNNDWDFEVWFLAKTEKGRFWNFTNNDFEYPYRFFSGMHFTFKDISLHFNAKVIWELSKKKPEIILFGGSWLYPTNIFSSFLNKFISQSKQVLWVESHFQSSKHLGLVSKFIRKAILNFYDSFAVPGEKSRVYVNYFARNPAIYFLPNVVDKELFIEKVREHKERKLYLLNKWRVKNNDRVYLLPARLHPSKGIREFIHSLVNTSYTKSFIILIAGDGYLKSKIHQEINNSKLNIKLLGQCSSSDMLELYAISDIFLLPSLIDPNPLSVIEALWSSLPILISNRLGNEPETLVEGCNGWGFNPLNKLSVENKFLKSLLTNNGDLEQMGYESFKIACEKFDPYNVVKNFVNSIIKN